MVSVSFYYVLVVFPVWKVCCKLDKNRTALVSHGICRYEICEISLMNRLSEADQRPDKFCQFLTRPFSSDQGLNNWNRFASSDFLGNTFATWKFCAQNSIETFNISSWWHCNSTRCSPWDKLVPMAFVRWAPPSAAGYRHIPSHIHGSLHGNVASNLKLQPLSYVNCSIPLSYVDSFPNTGFREAFLILNSEAGRWKG